MARILSLLYGVAAYAFFLVTFLYAIGFIGNLLVPKTIDTGAEPITVTAVLVNLVLLGIFAIQHTIMARPAFKRWWTTIVPRQVERSTFVLFATLALALLLWQWRPISGVVWAVSDPAGVAVLQGLFFLGWAILFAATFMVDHFDLFGLRQVALYAAGRPYTPPEFKTVGLYRYVRHPIMLGFIIAFWAAPVMTVGHLLFSAATTAYIFIGVAFEEHDLRAHFGATYEAYRRQVPKFIPLPGIKTADRAPSSTSP